MAPYTIELLAENETVKETRTAWHEHDDAAIDWAGALSHPQAIKISQGERHVATFPPCGAASGFCFE